MYAHVHTHMYMWEMLEKKSKRTRLGRTPDDEDGEVPVGGFKKAGTSLGTIDKVPSFLTCFGGVQDL